MATEHRVKVLIIGSGPAGYTAATYAARASLEPLVVTGLQAGGQLTLTVEVENYPGFAEAVDGTWLVEQMRAQAERHGARVAWDTITQVDLSARPFVAKGDSGDTYVADALLIATGAQARWLGLESERRFRESAGGVSACAVCDGAFFKGREVVVVGGGNAAVDEALYLTNHASKVTLVHRRGSLRAEKVMQERLFRNPKVEVVWDTVVEEVLGTDSPAVVTGVRVRNLATGAGTTIPCDGVFVAIGHDPASGLFEGQVATDGRGYVVVEPGTARTSVEGVWACGDVADPRWKQAVTAAAMGCMAALDAERWLAAREG